MKASKQTTYNKNNLTVTTTNYVETPNIITKCNKQTMVIPTIINIIRWKQSNNIQSNKTSQSQLIAEIQITNYMKTTNITTNSQKKEPTNQPTKLRKSGGRGSGAAGSDPGGPPADMCCVAARICSYWLVGWLVAGWLVCLFVLVGWLVGWLIVCLFVWLFGWLVGLLYVCPYIFAKLCMLVCLLVCLFVCSAFVFADCCLVVCMYVFVRVCVY